MRLIFILFGLFYIGGLWDGEVNGGPKNQNWVQTRVLMNFLIKNLSYCVLLNTHLIDLRIITVLPL